MEFPGASPSVPEAMAERDLGSQVSEARMGDVLSDQPDDDGHPIKEEIHGQESDSTEPSDSDVTSITTHPSETPTLPEQSEPEFDVGLAAAGKEKVLEAESEPSLEVRLGTCVAIEHFRCPT